MLTDEQIRSAVLGIKTDPNTLAPIARAIESAVTAPLLAEIERFTPYLKDGETPIERLERECKDNAALLGLLAKDRARIAELEAQAAESAPLDCLHINRGSADAEAEEYAAEYGAQLAQGKADADLRRGALQTVAYYVRDAIRCYQASNAQAEPLVLERLSEREAFEAWYVKTHGVPMNSRTKDDGTYGDWQIQCQFDAFIAGLAAKNGAKLK